jgi:hypothetical protein
VKSPAAWLRADWAVAATSVAGTHDLIMLNRVEFRLAQDDERPDEHLRLAGESIHCYGLRCAGEERGDGGAQGSYCESPVARAFADLVATHQL